MHCKSSGTRNEVPAWTRRAAHLSDNMSSVTRSSVDMGDFSDAVAGLHADLDATRASLNRTQSTPATSGESAARRSTPLRRSRDRNADHDENLGRGCLLSACVLQSQMFFLLGQKTTKLALHLFQHIALAVVEPLARGFALWRERGRRFFRFGHSAPQTRPALQTFHRPCFHFQTQPLHKMAASL